MSCCNHKVIGKTPSTRTQVRNLALSVVNVLVYVRHTGKIKADPQVIRKRIARCNECPHRNQNRCSECGCFIHGKAGLVAERCPLKKW